LEYEENRKVEIRDEQKLAKLPKALDGKGYILVLQTVMCVVILSIALIIKNFFGDLYKETKLFYKENFENTLTASEVVASTEIGSIVSETSSVNNSSTVSTSSFVAAGGPQEDSQIVFNEIRANIISNSFLVPLKSYTVSSPFGSRTDPISNTKATHNGVDLAADFGDEIMASLSGGVEFAGYDASYGYYVIIKHSESLKTVYAHCSSLKVKTGDFVKAGQIIALVGSTGRSTGPHLHFEVILNENKVNPENYVKLK